MSKIVRFPVKRAEPELSNDNGDKLTLFGFGSYGFVSICFLLPGAKRDDDRYISIDVVTHNGRRRIEPYVRWQLSLGPDVEPEYLPLDPDDYGHPDFICQHVIDQIGHAKDGDEEAIEELREIAEQGWNAILYAKEDRELYAEDDED